MNEVDTSCLACPWVLKAGSMEPLEKDELKLQLRDQPQGSRRIHLSVRSWVGGSIPQEVAAEQDGDQRPQASKGQGIDI